MIITDSRKVKVASPEQIAAVKEAFGKILIKVGADSDTIEYLLSDDFELVKFVQGLMDRHLPKPLLPCEVEEYLVKIDRGLPFADILAHGNYGQVNSYITEKNFPLSPKGPIRKKEQLMLLTVHFNREISGFEVADNIRRNGWLMASLSELFALGNAYPELQKQFPIIALGSSLAEEASGLVLVPKLGCKNSLIRTLGLDYRDQPFKADCRFLAIAPLS